jgi:hypothetical protein
MEVKSIFVNLIMKNYEKSSPEKSNYAHQDAMGREPDLDTISISPQASKRLFGDLMEHSLKKGLSGVRTDEN